MQLAKYVSDLRYIQWYIENIKGHKKIINKIIANISDTC